MNKDSNKYKEPFAVSYTSSVLILYTSLAYKFIVDVYTVARQFGSFTLISLNLGACNM